MKIYDYLEGMSSNGSRLSAVILAAGFSSRMGELKPLMVIEGKTVLERQIRSLRVSGIRDITVVAGYEAERVIASISDYEDVFRIRNNNFREGMFTSVVAGLERLRNTVSEAVVILPVDCLLMRPVVINRMMEVYDSSEAEIIYPVYKGRRGHPPLFSSGLIKSILEYREDGGLRGALESSGAAALDLSFDYPEIPVDMDTPDDFAAVSGIYEAHQIPDSAECSELLEQAGAPYQVQYHCERVSEIAYSFALELNGKGAVLDAELCRAAGHLHDIARTCPSHDLRGSEYLRLLGYNRIAHIVEQHMKLREVNPGIMTETKLVYWADKITEGERILGLEQRYINAAKTKGFSRDALRNIKLRFGAAFAIQEEIERLLGVPVEKLLASCG